MHAMRRGGGVRIDQIVSVFVYYCIIKPEIGMGRGASRDRGVSHHFAWRIRTSFS